MKKIVVFMLCIMVVMSISGCGSLVEGLDKEDSAAEIAQAEAEVAKAEAEVAKAEAEKAIAEAEKAKAEAEAIQAELDKKDEEEVAEVVNKDEDTKSEKVDSTKVDDSDKKSDKTTDVTTDTSTEVDNKPSDTLEITDLSDDVYSFQMSLDGLIYQFPMKYSEFVARGWEYDGDDTATISPGQYSITEVFDLGDVRVYCNIVNFDVNVIEKNEGYIGSIQIDDYSLDESGVELVMPSGLVFGKATLEDIAAAYGKPSEEYVGELYTKSTYSQDSYERVIVQVDAESGVLSSVDIRNFKAPEMAEAPTINKEVPEIVKNYKTPEALGDDMTLSIVEYDGDLYQMPMPVSVMIENGWKIVDGAGSAVVAKGFASIDIMKNNQTVHVYMMNYADYATVVENCFVTHIKSSVNGPEVPMTLPGNISIGTDKEVFLAAIESLNVEEEDGSTYTYYKVKEAKRSVDYIEVIVSKETNKITKIEMDSDELK